MELVFDTLHERLTSPPKEKEPFNFFGVKYEVCGEMA